MGIIVPVLRLALTSLNIYETFKTLKVPKISSRTGQPSQKAMTQRKRDMKGIMTVWMVWCFYATYENTADPFVGIFVPFYDELKSLVLIFFIVTRARGAEPIYLHVLRPLIKPHTDNIDSILDALNSIGDFIALLLAWPWHAAVARYRRWAAPRKQEDTGLRSGAGVNNYSQTAIPAQSRLADDPGAPDNNEPWIPPPPAYEEQQRAVDGLPHFSASLNVHVNGAPEQEEWRKYPNLPSAYPASPPSKSFRIVAPVPMRPSDVIDIDGIAEDNTPPNGPTPGENTRQGFPRSLSVPRESMNPDSDRPVSDEDLMTGVQVSMECEDEEMSDEEGDEDPDDSMDMTLRTPKALREAKGGGDYEMQLSDEDEEEEDSFCFTTPRALKTKGSRRPRAQLILSANAPGQQSVSTSLNTNKSLSSSRTGEADMESDSSTASNTVPAAGRKRPLVQSAVSQNAVRVRVRADDPVVPRSFSNKPQPSKSKLVVPRVRSGTTKVKPVDIDLEETDTATDSSSVTKRRKITVTASPRARKQTTAAPRVNDRGATIPKPARISGKSTIPTGGPVRSR